MGFVYDGDAGILGNLISQADDIYIMLSREIVLTALRINKDRLSCGQVAQVLFVIGLVSVAAREGTLPVLTDQEKIVFLYVVKDFIPLFFIQRQWHLYALVADLFYFLKKMFVRNVFATPAGAKKLDFHGML